MTSDELIECKNETREKINGYRNNLLTLDWLIEEEKFSSYTKSIKIFNCLQIIRSDLADFDLMVKFLLKEVEKCQKV